LGKELKRLARVSAMSREPLRLSAEEQSLLREVVAARAPDLRAAALDRGLVGLGHEQLKQIEDAIAREFTASGLREDSEPNARGMSLERILDAVLRELVRHEEAQAAE
jgi:hypothetical protein